MSFAAIQSLLPQIILALGATLVLLLGAWIPGRRDWIYCGVVIAVIAAFVSATFEPLSAEVGGMFLTSVYARFCAVLWSGIVIMTLLISRRYCEMKRFRSSEYTALLLFAAAGMGLLSAASSLFGLFLGLESFTLVLYILIAFNREDDRSSEAAIKYLVFGAVATGFIAFGIALIYTAVGTFHLPEAMTGLIVDGRLRPLGLAGWAMLLVAVGFKVSLAPFHLWTPDVYQGAPAPVSALLATAAKGAVLTALLPLLTLLGAAGGDVKSVLWLVAILTMLLGTFVALPQTNIKRMLAYSSVVHMGYLVMALLVGGIDGSKALLFYLIIYTFATFGAFAVITSLSSPLGELQEYRDLRGVGYLYPKRSIILSLFMFSLAGIPPLAGFFAKFSLFRTALAYGYGELAVIGIFSSLVSVYYYLRPVITMFMQNQDVLPDAGKSGGEESFVLACCVFAIVFLGIYPTPLFTLVASIF